MNANDLPQLLWVATADNLAFTGEPDEAITEVTQYFTNDKGTPMVFARTTLGRQVCLPQAFIEVEM